MTNKSLALALLVLAACHHAKSAGVPQCPVELQPSAIDIHASAGWKPFVPRSLPLYAARMASGPPEALGVLVGESVPGRKRATAYAWTVPGFSQGMWLQCLYGDGGEMVLSQRLPEPIGTCVIEYLGPKGAVPPKVVVSCT